MLWPFWCLGFSTFFFSLWAILAVGSDLYMSDISDRLDAYKQKTSIADFIALGVVAVVIVMFIVGVWWPSFTAPTENPYMANYKNSSKNKWFTPVPKAVQKMDAKRTDLCYDWTTTGMPAVVPSTNFSTLGSHGGYRVAILARNADLRTSNHGGAVTGTDEARYLFFAGQNNSNDAFAFVKGRLDQVNTYLKSTKICPRKLDTQSMVYIRVEELNMDDLNTQALKTTESTATYVAPTPTGTSSPGDILAGFPEYSGSLKGSYNVRFLKNTNLMNAQVVGKL
jgi:hypothetical protein